MRVPVLSLGNILLTSIQSDVTDEEALDLQSEILKSFEKGDALGVILDISALDVVDSYMVRVLSDTARMVRVMGGEVVVSGMSPMVAVALIEMGRELVNVATSLTLEKGLEKLKEQLKVVEGDPLGITIDG